MERMHLARGHLGCVRLERGLLARARPERTDHAD